jgi:predicted dehydrogenase
MDNSRPLRVGVVGVNFGAAVHIPGYQSEGVDVVAICSRRQERGEEAARHFGVARVFTDYAELLRQPDLDAVSIVTPVPLHHEMALQALAAGKHVVCEKPFTTHQALAREMWERAAASGRTAMIAHEFRFASARMRVKELIDEGYVGEPRLCVMRLILGGGGRGAAAARPPGEVQPYVAERDSAALGAGYLWGLGSHYIDCLRHWFGEVDSVSGDVANFRSERLQGSEIVHADADDTFLFTLRFANGCIAHMVASRGVSFGTGATVEVYGSKGTLVTPQRGVNPPAHGTLFGGQLGRDEGTQELPIPERLQPFADDRDDRLMPFRLFTREFLRGIREGTSPAPNFYDGWRCQQVLDAVRESSATGRRVQIAD